MVRYRWLRCALNKPFEVMKTAYGGCVTDE